jgi:glutathione peroxidase
MPIPVGAASVRGVVSSMNSGYLSKLERLTRCESAVILRSTYSFVHDKMSPFTKLLRVLTILAGIVLAWPAAAAECPSLLKHSFPRLPDGVPQSLCQYQGKVILVVNTASFCGFTGQYEGLETVYDKYKDRGLVVIGFPSNDFGEQEPGGNKEIAEFCRMTYGVKFPMMAKTDIVAPKTNAFYKQLIEKTGAQPKWNFHKYLIDRNGAQVESFDSRTTPDSKTMIARIESLLAAKTP